VIVSPPSQDFARSRERFRYWKKWKLARAYRQPGATTIAVSQEVADDAARYYKLDRQRIVVLPNPVDFDAVRQAANEVIEEKSPVDSSDKLRMVVVGRLSHEKGQRTALRALQLANLQTGRKWHLDFVGDGPDRGELESLANELGIAKDVSFVGFQSNPHPFMRRATLVCIPSLYEGLPNVALEAMALNCGVLASDCSESLRRLVGQNERGQLAPVGDSAAIAKAMATRLQQTEVWEKRCRQAETWVREQHAIGPWLEEMQRIFLNSVQ
jgi:glycosyltransferase involved in cell wall biosynthesis